MTHLEDASAKRQKRANIENLILQGVASVGLLAVALVAPNVVGAMGKLGLIPKRRQGEYINDARRKLKRDGLLVERDGFLRLTQKGERELLTMSARMMAPKSKKWDKKWRVLIFDIPEKRRLTRDKVRWQLRRSGFVRAQDSVWIYPYPCEEFVALLKSDCRVGKDMLYLIVDSLEGDARFRKLFNLPLSDASPSIRITGTPGKLLDAIMPENTVTRRDREQ